MEVKAKYYIILLFLPIAVSQVMPPSHYSRIGVFLFKIAMHVKTVQIEFFAIEIIISIHISCLKKVLPKCEN